MPHQVVEEAELDLHQRAVARVLALELVRAAPSARRCARSPAPPGRGVHQRAAARSSVTVSAATPRRSPLRIEQPRALLLEQLAAAHLAAQHPGEAHDRLDVAVADRRALLEDDREQAARRVRSARRGAASTSPASCSSCSVGAPAAPSRAHGAAARRGGGAAAGGGRRPCRHRSAWRGRGADAARMRVQLARRGRGRRR